MTYTSLISTLLTLSFRKLNDLAFGSEPNIGFPFLLKFNSISLFTVKSYSVTKYFLNTSPAFISLLDLQNCFKIHFKLIYI